jgi:hypothetical protein
MSDDDNDSINSNSSDGSDGSDESESQEPPLKRTRQCSRDKRPIPVIEERDLVSLESIIAIKKKILTFLHEIRKKIRRTNGEETSRLKRNRAKKTADLKLEIAKKQCEHRFSRKDHKLPGAGFDESYNKDKVNLADKIENREADRYVNQFLVR